MRTEIIEVCRRGVVAFVHSTGWLQSKVAHRARPLLLLPLLTLPAVGQQFTCITNHGTITITGYTGPGGDVQIPPTLNGLSVTGIGGSAFSSQSTLTSVSIPNSVTTIANNAFFGSTNLQSIVVGTLNDKFSSVDGVLLDKDQTALVQCPPGRSGSYTVPGSVTSVADDGFYGCVNLTAIQIPDSVTSIGEQAFDGCVGLQTIQLSPSVKSIGASAFYGCVSLTGLTIPNSVTSLGDGAFSSCGSVTNVVLPNSVTKLEDELFSGCTNLSTISIPNSVTTIGDHTFENCASLTNVTIPNSVTRIGAEAFNGCTSLANVTLPNKLSTIQDNTFAYCSNLNSVTLPVSVGSIGDSVFLDCASLATITIPNKLSRIGSYAFKGCSGLVSFNATNSLTSIGVGAFSGCTSLPQIALPQKLSAIQDNTFSGCTSLTNVLIPKSVRSIGDFAFEGCTSLTTLTLPTAVSSVGNNVFAGCTKLTGLILPSSVKSLGNNVFADCSGLVSVTLSKSIRSLGNSVFVGCSNLTSAAIPGSVGSIGDSAFSGCVSLFNLAIPSSVTKIGNNAFSGCVGLTSVTMSGNLQSLGDYAFADCTSLASVTLPAKITSIGNYTFQGCTSLASIVISGKVTRIGNYAFNGCTSLASVTISTSVTSIGDYAFAGCSSLTGIIIPGSVIGLGYQAFANCPALTGVYFTGAPPSSVDAGVFAGDANLKVYYLSNATGWGTTFSGAPAAPANAPLIVLAPASQEVLIGGKASFSVSAFGPGQLHYQWQFNGANINGAKSSTYSVASVQSKNAGSYTVVVANSDGDVVSAPAVLVAKGVAGTYRGLISATNGFDSTNSGAFVLTVTSGGAYSAKFTFPGQSVSASGRFVVEAGDTNTAIARFTNQIGGRTVQGEFLLALDSSTLVSGSMTAFGSTNAVAQIDGAMVAAYTNFGTYNVAVSPAGTNPPAGYGYGTVTVSKKGVTISLTLADDKAVVTALAADYLQNGTIPVFAPLYSKKGFISGWLTLTNQQALSVAALAWHKEPGASKTFFAQGFNQWVEVQGGLYTPVSDLTAWGAGSLFVDGQALAGTTLNYAGSTDAKGGLSIPVNGGQPAVAPWSLTSASGLVKLGGGGLTGSGILVPATAPEPGIYGFATNSVIGAGMVHAIASQPAAAQ